MNLMFKDSSSFSMFTQLTFMFSLQFANYGCFSPCLLCLVSFMICMLNSKEFIYGTFEDCIGLFNSHFHSFLCQNLFQVILLLVWQFSKSVWATFHHKLAQHNFWEFIFNFDARRVSRKFTTYQSPPKPKMIADAVYRISSA